MAQFEVFRSAEGGDLIIDCQSDLLRHLNTRFAVPLIPIERAPTPAGRLNPLFEIDGDHLSMMTQFAGAIPASEFTELVCSVEERRLEIIGALDMLTGGV